MRRHLHAPRAARTATAVAAVAALLLAGGALPASAHGRPTPTPQAARLYVPPPPDGSLQQVAQLLRQRDPAGAFAIAKMVTTPQAVWLTKGTPAEVRHQVKASMLLASLQRAVPTFVVYNLPYRDCGQYSSGGAAGTTAYRAWIDAVVKGLGGKQATVILEPDGLGLIPNYVSALDGSSNCTMPADPALPADAQPTPENRFAQLTYAVDALMKGGRTSVYLDATHTAWQNVGESADRLVKAGAQRATGFFLNASNYQWTSNLVQYGTWVSRCMAYATQVNPGDFNGCPNQYWNGGPSNGWTGVALDNHRVWVDGGGDLAIDVHAINERYAADALGSAVPTAHFVVDTSRNGQGPWVPTVTYPDAQDWCNPPGRGVGDRPKVKPVAGNDLVDAYLWIKTPGQSDGQCSRGTGGTTDPEWGGITDPAAGAWFPQQARQLATLAVPKL
jgi:endoglucanase